MTCKKLDCPVISSFAVAYNSSYVPQLLHSSSFFLVLLGYYSLYDFNIKYMLAQLMVQ